MAALAGAAGATTAGKICVKNVLEIVDTVESRGWGPQHNTHVANATNSPVKILLQHSKGGCNQRVIDPKEYFCFPTPKGNVTVYVIPYVNKSFGIYADAVISDKSDRSFIVKKASTGDLVFAHSKYGGNVWQEEKGARPTRY